MEKFTKEEFDNLKSVVNSIKNYIPKDKMNLIWESYKRISNSTEPQPCSCPHSGKHWKKAYEMVSEYVKSNGE